MPDRLCRATLPLPLQTNSGCSESNNTQQSLYVINENQKGFQIDSKNIVNDDENLNILKASKPYPNVCL